MALTPEQVLNKHFQTTQFRRGYEERDVDDFLDEIVAEMRSLIEQRDDYLKQLNDCRASKNQSAVRADGATAAMPAVARPGDEAKLGGLTPRGIRTHLGLNKPIYAPTAAYGHFGRQPEGDYFPWEKTDLVDDLKAALA